MALKKPASHYEDILATLMEEGLVDYILYKTANPVVTKIVMGHLRNLIGYEGGEKTCGKCRESLPVGRFNRSKGTLHSYCKSCQHDYYLTRKAMKAAGFRPDGEGRPPVVMKNVPPKYRRWKRKIIVQYRKNIRKHPGARPLRRMGMAEFVKRSGAGRWDGMRSVHYVDR